LPPEHTQFFIIFLTQFYNVKWVKKNLLNIVFGSKMGTHRNEWELILYLGQKWAPIEMNGKNCNLEQSKISQNKTPGDSKVTSSLGFTFANKYYIVD